MSDDPQYTESNDASRPDERKPNGQTFFGGLRERLEWALRATVLVFILAAAAFLSAITAMRVAIHGREVSMPNLVGKNVSEAGSMRVRAGWDCAWRITSIRICRSTSSCGRRRRRDADESFATGTRRALVWTAAVANSFD